MARVELEYQLRRGSLETRFHTTHDRRTYVFGDPAHKLAIVLPGTDTHGTVVVRTESEASMKHTLESLKQSIEAILHEL